MVYKYALYRKKRFATNQFYTRQKVHRQGYTATEAKAMKAVLLLKNKLVLEKLLALYKVIETF
jgi:hypothetical protein